MARALNSLAETLQREEALRKESVADLAHELRTPVMGLLGRIEAAQDGVFSDQAANLDAMHDEAVRLTRLLDDLSALADAERPGILLERAPVDLAAVAARQVAAVADQFASRDIAAGRRAGGRDRRRRRGPTPADRRQSPRQRTAVLGRRAGASPCACSARPTRPCSRWRTPASASPNGDREHVFERFWRGEKSRSRSTGGAGIGLAIVKALAQAHGGDVQREQRARAGVHVPRRPCPSLPEGACLRRAARGAALASSTHIFTPAPLRSPGARRAPRSSIGTHGSRRPGLVRQAEQEATE